MAQKEADLGEDLEVQGVEAAEADRIHGEAAAGAAGEGGEGEDAGEVEADEE